MGGQADEPSSGLTAVLDEVIPQLTNGLVSWPTGWPLLVHASEGVELVEFTINPNAWTLVIEGGLPRVLDAQNEYVAHERLVATPERIATIYYARDDASGGPDCGGAEGGLAARFHLIINPDQVDHVETRTVRLDELRMSWRAGLVSLRDTSLPSSIGSDLNRDASCVYWHSQSDGCDSWQNVARVLVVPDREYDYEANFGGIVERLK